MSSCYTNYLPPNNNAMQPNQIIITVVPTESGPAVELKADSNIYMGTAIWALDITKKTFSRAMVERATLNNISLAYPISAESAHSLNMLTVADVIGECDYTIHSNRDPRIIQETVGNPIRVIDEMDLSEG